MMKIPPLILGLAALIFAKGIASAVAADVMIGDRRENVLQILGTPTGHIGSSDHEIYYFDRGEVVFHQGRVQSHTLVSPEEMERREKALEQEREVRAQREREERERRIQEGVALQEKVSGDPSFATLPPSDRLAFWQSFRRKYPEIDVDFDYLVASRQAALESARIAEAARQAKAEQQRIRELERRVEEAEKQARLAQERSRDRYYDNYDSYHYPSRSPVVIVSDHSKKHSHHESDGKKQDRYPSRYGAHHPGHSKQEDSDKTEHPVDTQPTPREKAMTDSHTARQKAFDARGQARQREFDARWEAARARR